MFRKSNQKKNYDDDVGRNEQSISSFSYRRRALHLIHEITKDWIITCLGKRTALRKMFSVCVSGGKRFAIGRVINQENELLLFSDQTSKSKNQVVIPTWATNYVTLRDKQYKKYLYGAVQVLAQLVEQSLPTPEVRGHRQTFIQNIFQGSICLVII